MNTKPWLDKDKISEKEIVTLFIEEAKIIQNIINRMANNSFLVKGWTITLVVGVFILKPEGQRFLFASLLPTIGFWLLDAFFLHQEKLYREIYINRIETRLEYSDDLFSLDTRPFKDKVSGILSVMFSTTLIIFYLMIILLILGCFYFI